MFRITRRSRLIAGLAITGAVALVPAAVSSAADAPPAGTLRAAPMQKSHAPAAKQDQGRKAMKKLGRVAKRAGFEPADKSAGRGYFTSNGYGCFYSPTWNYTICFGYTGYGSGSYQIFEWGDSAGRSGYAYISTLEVFLYGIGG